MTVADVRKTQMTTIDPISFNLWKSDKEAFAKAFGESFKETGFAIISDHTIAQDIIDAADAASKKYFALPEDTKREYADPDDGFQRGHSVAIYLKLDENWFDDKVNVGNSILRLLHYPPQKTPPPQGTERAGAHEDINLITLLLGAEEAGLQAKHRSGKWLDVNAPFGYGRNGGARHHGK